ncbi:MAG: hypothetical protein AAB393_06320 [Bacteroidota bacterium]
MTEELHPLSIRISRYGLPVVVGIFYVTAALGFSYTAESTFHLVSVGASPSGFDVGFPSPLLQFLLWIAGSLQLDRLLAAKVLSMVFACCVILIGYLVANEILRDRLIAFCVSLVLGMQSWLLQAAPSGAGLSLALMLALGALFFMLRNEYVVAPFLFGLCTLVFWQAAVLLIVLCVDIWINSVSKERAGKVILSALLVYVSALLPWLLYSWTNHIAALPELLQIQEMPQLSFASAWALVLLMVLAVAGFLLALWFSSERNAIARSSLGVWMFIFVVVLLGLFQNSDVWYAALPLVVVYAFTGLEQVLKRVGRHTLFYSASFVLTGLLIVHQQIDFRSHTKPVMASAIAQLGELQIIADWIHANSQEGQTVCAEKNGVVEYYAGKPIARLDHGAEGCGDFVVTSRDNVDGYTKAFVPAVPSGTDEILARHFAVWRRN